MEHENFSDTIGNTSEIDDDGVYSCSGEEAPRVRPFFDEEGEFDSSGSGEEASKGHLLTLLHWPIPNSSYWDTCRVCDEELGCSPAVFRCKKCEINLHIKCALPPTIKSKRHKHPLSFADSYADDNSADYYCNACEKPRNPTHPVYRCLECGSCFVTHVDCFFTENDLSIAHKLGDPTSTVLIISPALTLKECIESSAIYKAAGRDAIARVARSLEVVFGEVLRQDESVCSAQKVPIYSPEEFFIFMERYESWDARSELKAPEIYSQVANFAKILNSSGFAMLSFFPQFFTDDSTLNLNRESDILIALSMAIYNLCNPKDAHLSQDILLALWHCLRAVQLAGSKVRFGFPDSDYATDEVEKYITTLNLAVQLDEYMSTLGLAGQDLWNKRSQCAVSNISGERLSETLEMMEESMADSWNEYNNETTNQSDIFTMNQRVRFTENSLEEFINEPWPYTRKIEETELDKYLEETSEDSELAEDQPEESRLSETSKSGERDNIITWDFHILIDKIEAFAVQHGLRRSLCSFAHKHRMTINDEKNGGEVRCSGCKLPILESPIYGCTLCNFFLHRSCAELPRKIRCMLHDHILILGSFVHNSSTEEAYCFVCKLALWGPTYHCAKCKFFVHKLCVQLPLEIQHPLHPKHPLFLDLDHERVRTCHACGEQWRGCAFTCWRCNFFLEVRCFYLKPTITSQSHPNLLTLIEEPSISCRRRYCLACGENLPAHAPFLYCMLWGSNFHLQCCLPSKNTCTTHRHPLTLTDSYVEDDSEEFYCDNCEKERHPNHPIYLCKECNYVAHVSCENY